MPALRIILWNQLNIAVSSLQGCEKSKDTIFFCEGTEDTLYVKHHKKKLAFLFSAMRHFARELTDLGYKVHYIKIDNPENTGALKTEIQKACQALHIDQLIITLPPEYQTLKAVQSWEKDLHIRVEIRPDNNFLCSVSEFTKWANSRNSLRMEYFYREMRKKHNILLDDGEPVGGEWNYDAENRKKPKEGLKIPKPLIFKPDAITQEVIDLISARFANHFGDMEPFYFAVTRKEALQVLDKFIAERLPLFGDYQDAMIENEPWMFHSHISFYLNCGLLYPLECIQAAETAFRKNKAPLAATEGFIRQILGWREYVRGIYWLKMPEYKNVNFLNATRPLPDFYWSGKTKMHCVSQCVKETQQNAYAHHIQRLMVLGNFALLSGIDPKHVNEWYWLVYADAYEWVELPNVSGMVLFADGGLLASKPYAAGGAYINKMSNYCKNCTYNVDEKNGSKACPFNYLYWNFLIENTEKLQKNPRVAMMYKTLAKMEPSKKDAIISDAKHFLKTLE